MSENILVCVAWPYANADIHVGNIVGSRLPADIFARYQRLRGNRVLMVSGTDSHGTPVTIRADAEHTTPLAVYERFQQRFLDLLVQLGISFDLFTSTHTENHFKVSQDMFLALQQTGYLYREKQQMLYSETAKRFLGSSLRRTRSGDQHAGPFRSRVAVAGQEVAPGSRFQPGP